jgi:hypothetical protein
MADAWGSTSGDWGNVQNYGKDLYQNIGNQASTLMSNVVANNPWSTSGSGWGQYPDVRNPQTQSHLNSFMGQVMSGQRNQMDEYVRRAANAGVTRGGQNVQGGPSYASAANQQAMSNLASGYEGRFNQAMEYLANQYQAQNKAWTDAAQIGTQLYGVQQQGLNTMAGDISSARNYASQMAGQGSAERIAGIESTTALGTAGIQSDWQKFAAQKQLEAATEQANASRYGSEKTLEGVQGQTAAARYEAELQKQWQEYAAQKQLEATGVTAGATRYGAEQASGATKYASDQERLAQIQAALYGKEAQLGAAGLTSEATKYGATQAAEAQKYAALQDYLGQTQSAQTAAQAQLGTAGLQSEWEKFGATQQSEAQKYAALQDYLGQTQSAQTAAQAQLGTAGIQSEWEKYAAQQQLAGTQAQVAAQKYASELEKAWQEYNAQQQLVASLRQSQAQETAATTAAQAQLGTAGLQSEWEKFGATQQSEAQKYAALQSLYGQQAQATAQTTAASTQAEAAKYAAQQQLAGTQYQSQAEKEIAELQSAWQKYAAELGLTGTQAQATAQLQAAQQAADAQKYAAAQQLIGTQTQTQAQKDVAATEAAWQKYAAETGLTGQKYAADVQSEAQRYAAEASIRAAAAAKSGITPEATAKIAELYAQLQKLAPAYTLHGQHLAAEPTAALGLSPGQIVVSNLQSGQKYAYDPQAAGDTIYAQLPSWTGYQYTEGAPTANTYTGTTGVGYTFQPIYYTDSSTGQQQFVSYQELLNGQPTGKYKSQPYSSGPGDSNYLVNTDTTQTIPGSTLRQTGYDDAFLNWNNTATNVFSTAPVNDPFFSMYYMSPDQVSQWNSLLSQIGVYGGSTGDYKSISDYQAKPLADYYTVGSGGVITPYSYNLKTWNPTTNAWG